MKEEKPFWDPYVAGIALGLLLLVSFVITGKGLGGSGVFKRLGAVLLHELSPTWAEENALIGNYFASGLGALNSWIVFLAIGVAIGGVAGALTAGRFRLQTIRGPRIGRDGRLALALLGGILCGVGAQIARGCTSGQALTGGSQLALGSWVFMFAVFGGAYGIAYFVRRQWI